MIPDEPKTPSTEVEKLPEVIVETGIAEADAAIIDLLVAAKSYQDSTEQTEIKRKAVVAKYDALVAKIEYLDALIEQHDVDSQISVWKKFAKELRLIKSTLSIIKTEDLDPLQLFEDPTNPIDQNQGTATATTQPATPDTSVGPDVIASNNNPPNGPPEIPAIDFTGDEDNPEKGKYLKLYNKISRVIKTARGTNWANTDEVDDLKLRKRGIVSELDDLEDEKLHQDITDRVTLLNEILIAGQKSVAKESTIKAEKGPGTVAERERKIVKESLEKFFDQRGIPLRESKPEYKDLKTYLQAVHGSILKIVAATILNEKLDKSDEVRTVSYEKEPLFGPSKEFHLLGQALTYDTNQDSRIKNIEALLDLFHNYFDDPHEAHEAKEFAEDRLKGFFREVSVWHNRAYHRRQGIEEHKAGPDQAKKELGVLYRKTDLSPNLKSYFEAHPDEIESEKNVREAIEYSCSVWATMSLKVKDRARLWNNLDSRVQKMYQTTGEWKYHLKPEYKIIPLYNSDREKSLKVIREIITNIKQMGFDDAQAELIYDIGEKFRIGSGMEAFQDASFKKPDGALQGNVTVTAQWGESKAANIGEYVESANKSEDGTDFNEAYSTALVHGYTPFLVSAQYNHNMMGVDISGLGDKRATLAQIMSVKGAIQTVEWNTQSSQPDKITYDAAAQTIDHLWTRSTDKAGKSFLFDHTKIPISTSALLDQTDEQSILSNIAGYEGEIIAGVTEFFSKVSFRRPKENFEEIGFLSTSNVLSGQEKSDTKELIKNFRKYWLSAFTTDIDRYPTDLVRIMDFLFTRDDSTNGYVNAKIGRKIDELKNQARNLSKKELTVYLKEHFIPWFKGYFTYDFLMRATFHLIAPDYRNNLELTYDQQEVAAVYGNLSYSNFEDLIGKTRGGQDLLNVSKLNWVINRFMQVYQMFMIDQGDAEIADPDKGNYKLFETAAHAPEGQMFDHEDLLRLAQQFGLGEGYEVVELKDSKGQPFVALRRVKGHPPTLQYIVDRLTLLAYLFNRPLMNLGK